MPQTAEYWREMRRKRREQGLCTRCGKRPPEAGRNHCSECLDRLVVIAREGRGSGNREPRRLSGEAILRLRREVAAEVFEELSERL